MKAWAVINNTTKDFLFVTLFEPEAINASKRARFKDENPVVVSIEVKVV